MQKAFEGFIAHNSLAASLADRLMEMKNGRVVKERVQDSLADLEGIKW
ncbi:MAG: hypothetical protein ACOWWO_15900 [Peptococcaceae bacterium]